MGNCQQERAKHELSKENLLNYEKQVLDLSEVDSSLIVVKDVKVGEFDK